MRTITFFEDDKGKCEALDFIESLDKKTREKTLSIFELIEELHIIPQKYFKKLVGTKGIYEIRVEYTSNIYRYLAFFEKNKLIIVTHGFQKKSQKTPAKEIKKAENIKKIYLNN